MLLLLIILIVTVFAWIFYQRAYGRFVELGNRLPGPKNIPILGNAHHFINLPAEDNLKVLGMFFKEFGNTYRLWLGMELDILFRDLKDLEVIMTGMEFSKKADVYDLMKPWLNEGVLLSSGKKWHARRKFITPAFHFKILDEYLKVFEVQSKLFCKVLEKQLHFKSIDLHQFVSRYTLDVILGKKPEEFFGLMMGFFEKYGDTIKIWLGTEFNIVTSDLKSVEIILGTTKFNDKAGHYKTMDPWLREGLLVSRGRKWFKRRKIITPAFHFKVLDQFIEVFECNGKKLVENFRSQMNKSFDLYFYVNLCTLDTICESAMGVSVNAQTSIDSEYVQAVKTISTVLHKRMFDLLYRFDITYRFTKLAREERNALKILHGFTEKIIIQRREEILRAKSNNIPQDETNEFGQKRKKAFLDILLESEIDGKPLSNLDIREEVDTFVFEGHDTTSSAITFFFYNIATHPESQKKCFQEIYEIFGKDESAHITHEDLNKLHYTELCIKETLRLFPSVPLLGRKVTEECEINGKIIPAGANIGISPLHLGRMEEIFPKADEFIPERFDVVTNTEKMNPFSYIPFSAGPRNCIGQKFAMLEIKSVVTNVLRTFEVEYVGTASGEPLLIAELILRTRDPLMFKLKPRIYP